MKNAISMNVHGAAGITFGRIHQLPGYNAGENRFYMTIRIDHHFNDSMPTEITVFAPTHNELIARYPPSHYLDADKMSDDEQSAIDQSPPHPMKKD